MTGVDDESCFTVYASHILEHLDDPILALRNWYRILMRGGHLICCVPHRDLYEKRKTLPSRWNGEHKTFWLPQAGEPPCTFGLAETIVKAIPTAKLVMLRVLDDNFIDSGIEHHSLGEFSIEAVVQKP